MPDFCDVALPVPLDTAFTYRIPEGMQPVIGGRVLVPFRQQRMSGVVIALHDHAPKVQAKNIFSVLDAAPVLDPQLLQLGQWIADYYLAPLGEVLRTMLPLAAEFKRAIAYRITNEGQMALHLAGTSGSSARSRKTPEEQLAEIRVLDYLAEHENAREESLRNASGVSKLVLAGMVHIMYGDGIPERVNRRLGGNPSALLINGSDFGRYPGIADYLLVTEGHKELPKAGILGVSILDGGDSVYVSEFASGSAAQAAGIEVGDHILALNGMKVANMTELKAMMFDKQPGDSVQVEVLRNSMMGSKKELRFGVTLR